jgi:hypothetical protein
METSDDVTRLRAPSFRRFSDIERTLLASEPGIGDRVIKRLEEIGFSSIAQMKVAGAAQIVDAVCNRLGSAAWRNRRRSLERALACATLAAIVDKLQRVPLSP